MWLGRFVSQTWLSTTTVCLRPSSRLSLHKLLSVLQHFKLQEECGGGGAVPWRKRGDLRPACHGMCPDVTVSSSYRWQAVLSCSSFPFLSTSAKSPALPPPLCLLLPRWQHCLPREPSSPRMASACRSFNKPAAAVNTTPGDMSSAGFRRSFVGSRDPVT